MKISIPCSPEQLEVLADHFFENKEIRMQPDERHWMISQARKKIPGCKILSADLDIEKGEWALEVQEP